MKDENKPKERLIKELRDLKKRITELEAVNIGRKCAEEEIRLLKEKYEDLYQNAPIMYLSLDINGIIIEYNKMVLDRLGYTKKEFFGKHITKFLTKEYAAKFKKGFPKLLKTGKRMGIERQLVTKSGEIIDVLLDGTTECDEHGKPIKARATFEDITQRKHMEKALQESEEKFRGIAEESFDMIFMVDCEETIIYISPAIKKILGYSPKEVLGKPLQNYLTEWEIPKIQHAFIQLMKGEHIKGLTLDFISKDGSIIFLEINATSLFKNGKIIGYQGIARDITDRKGIEEKMKKQLMKFKVEEGKLYLVEEAIPTLSLKVFGELLKVGYSGFVISRKPKKEFKRLPEGKFEFLRLSEIKGKDTLLPNLNLIEHKIENLPSRKIILLNRLSYLISKHGFKKILFFIQHLRELAIISNYVIIISVDPLTLSNQELLLLKKETFEVESLHKPKLPEPLLDFLRFIHEQNNIGIKPSYTDIGRELSLSQPTVRNRMRFLSDVYVTTSSKGKKKLVELTEWGKSIF